MYLSTYECLYSVRTNYFYNIKMFYLKHPNPFLRFYKTSFLITRSLVLNFTNNCFWISKLKKLKNWFYFNSVKNWSRPSKYLRICNFSVLMQKFHYVALLTEYSLTKFQICFCNICAKCAKYEYNIFTR